MSDEEYTSSEIDSSEEEENDEEESESEEEEQTLEETPKLVETKKEELKKLEPVPTIKSTSIMNHNDMTSSEADNSGTRKLTHQRKMLLKVMILNKAREELKREAKRKAEEKKAALNKRIQSLDKMMSMTQQELMDICRELHAKIDKVDEQRYDIEAKVRKNDDEIKELNQKIFDLRGKFKRPPLRRVRMSADQMLRALLGSKHKVSLDLRSNLKSVKKDVPKREETEVKDWRENVEAKQGMEGKVAVFKETKIK